MKYFIRTTNERKLDSSYSQVEYELLIDTNHNAKKSFVEQIEYISTLDDDCVILEDDLILCRDFKNRIEKVISEHSDEVINFFFNPNVYFKSGRIGIFFWNQCVYYPKQIIKLMAENLRGMYNKNPNMHHDLLEGFLFGRFKIKNYRYRPCLVQHLDFDTLIQDKPSGRRTPYFIDYLDDLGIKYENALEHREELISYMNKQFEKYKEWYYS